MKVFVVDPSMFTAPYDFSLLGGLVSAGADARLYGRVPRFQGEFVSVANYEPFFYRRSEAPRSAGLRGFKAPLKAAEHTIDMARFAATCRRERPSVVHFQWTPLPLVDSVALDAIARVSATVLTVHDTTPFNGNATSRLQLLHIERCWRKFDHIITHVEAGRRALIGRGVEPHRVSVVPHGLLAAESGRSSGAGRGRPGPLRILFFGQIKPYKGLDTLIEAVAHLSTELRRRVHLRICGQPYMDMSPILSKVEEAGLSDIVDFKLERIPDAEVDSLFSAADVIAMPYHRIDASGVLSKALAHGLAVLASDTGGFAEFLRHEENALLCPVGDADAFCRMVTRLATDAALVDRLRTNARRLGHATPSWSEIGARTLELYQDVAVRSGKCVTAGRAPRQATSPP